MKTPTLLFLLFIPLVLPAQDNARIIYPGTSFLNRTNDTLYCLPKHKLEILMEQEKIRNELIQRLSLRIVESDSLISLKTLEAQTWYNKLLENDNLLKDSELTRVQEKQRARKRAKIWFCAGSLMGLLIGVIL
jgi:hypothetical protein